MRLPSILLLLWCFQGVNRGLIGVVRPPPELPVFRTLTLRCSPKCVGSNRYILLDKKDYCCVFVNIYPLAEHPQRGALQDDLATDPHPRCACKSKGGFAGGRMEVWRDIHFDISCQNGTLPLPDTWMAPRQLNGGMFGHLVFFFLFITSPYPW